VAKEGSRAIDRDPYGVDGESALLWIQVTDLHSLLVTSFCSMSRATEFGCLLDSFDRPETDVRFWLRWNGQEDLVHGIIWTTTPYGKEGAMSIERNKEVVRRFDELTSGGSDLRELDDLCTPDIVNHALAPGRARGLDGTREFLVSARREQRSVRWVWSVVVAEGDYVVQFGSRAGEQGEGSFRGFRVPSGSYARDVAFLYRLVDGRIAERWAVRDDLGLLVQLGALSPEPRQ
jgi:predicted ester cyclase